jgi:hypothetical protein
MSLPRRSWRRQAERAPRPRPGDVLLDVGHQVIHGPFDIVQHWQRFQSRFEIAELKRPRERVQTLDGLGNEVVSNQPRLAVR